MADAVRHRARRHSQCGPQSHARRAAPGAPPPPCCGWRVPRFHAGAPAPRVRRPPRVRGWHSAAARDRPGPAAPLRPTRLQPAAAGGHRDRCGASRPSRRPRSGRRSAGRPGHGWRQQGTTPAFDDRGPRCLAWQFALARFTHADLSFAAALAHAAQSGHDGVQVEAATRTSGLCHREERDSWQPRPPMPKVQRRKARVDMRGAKKWKGATGATGEMDAAGAMSRRMLSNTAELESSADQ